VTADSRGRVGVSPTLIVQLGAQNPAGVYGYHYRGTASGVRADIYFTYTGAP
jgi:adenine deaminase